MSRISMFNSPLLLGFDQIERVLDQVSKTKAEGYPPYNIEKTGDGAYRITMAVAGFAESDLDVQLEDNQLTISGRVNNSAKDGPEIHFLHRGIAERAFERRFELDDHIKVVGGSLVMVGTQVYGNTSDGFGGAFEVGLTGDGGGVRCPWRFFGRAS
mgnify:CR=1 FL=1